MKLRRIEDLELAGKKVFLRLDLNVPIKGGKIQDDTRIRAALPTLRYLLERTNKIVIASHLGRPEGAADPRYSLEPVGTYLAEVLGREVVFVSDYSSEPADQVLNQINKDQIILLENLRFHPGETKNDEAFSRTLAQGLDVYVNDAFGTAHRAHASTVGAALQMEPSQRAAGFLIQRELEALGGILAHPRAPFTVVMGGAKVSDKIGVILNLLTRCNNLLIGGAMAYTFLKYKGVDVGTSRVEDDRMEMVESIFRNAEARKVRIYLPEDHRGAREFKDDAAPVDIDGRALPAGVMGLDVGPKTIKTYSEVIKASQTVLWNGPMGVFEWPAFAQGTMGVAEAMAACFGQVVIGGGDSVAAVNKAGVADRMAHISTGGGASLEFLEGRTLPGLKVLAV